MNQNLGVMKCQKKKKKDLKKNAIIFGDSYSTFDGYIPQGYDSYYPANWGIESSPDLLSQTWWQLAAGEA